MLLAVAVSGAWADGDLGNGVTWSLSGTTLTIGYSGSGSGKMKSYDEFDGTWAEIIVPWKDYASTIKSIVVEEGVTSIGTSAFYKFTDLTSVTLPASLTTINEGAFKLCSSLKEFTVPAGVKKIRGATFTDCGNLTEVTLLATDFQEICYQAFKDCSSLTTINIYAETPFEVSNNNTFGGTDALEHIYVPAGSVDAYKNNQYWSDLKGYIAAMPVTGNKLTVYDSNAISNSSIPFYGSNMNNYTRNEMLYPAAELADMSGADITSLTFYKTDENTESWGAASFKIYLMEVSNSALTAYIGMTGATVVYEGSVDATGGERPVTINFTTPYRYNGGNLLVGVYQTVKGSESIAAFYCQLVSGASSGSYASQDAASAPFSQQDGLPKTTFTYKPAPFDYEFTDVATDHGSGQVKFFIGSKEVEGAYEADEGKTVTVTIAPDEGWRVDPSKVTAEVYRYWEGSRRAQATVPMQRTVKLNYISNDANGVATYTFTMPASNVRVTPKYLKVSTLYFDPADKTNLMQVNVIGFPVNLDENDKTVKIEKVEDILEGSEIKLTANTGYKFRKVEVKKGGGTKILTIGTRQLTYVEGETWKDAIDNHPTENTGWVYYNSDVYNGSNKLYYSGWTSLDANTVVDSSKSYIFYE